MEVEVFKSKYMKGLMAQNTYVVKNGSAALIIDAGAELEDVKIALGGAKVQAILMTHLHFDHFWNIEEYLAEFGCKVYICEGAQDKFCEFEKNGSKLIRKPIVRKVADENVKFYTDFLKFDNFDVKILFTPGHSSDCVCIKIEDYLFCGDTLFADGIGRTDLYDSDENSMRESLKLLKNLDFKVAYPGHYERATKAQTDKVIDYYL